MGVHVSVLSRSAVNSKACSFRFQTKAVKQLRHPVAAGYLNIRGVYLHILADALGSVVVIISALIIWKTDWEYRFVSSSNRNLIRGSDIIIERLII